MFFLRRRQLTSGLTNKDVRTNASRRLEGLFYITSTYLLIIISLVNIIMDKARAIALHLLSSLDYIESY